MRAARSSPTARRRSSAPTRSPTTCRTRAPAPRSPHLWLERDAARLSSLDLFDTAFVLLTGRDGDPWREAATAIAQQDRVPLHAYRLGTSAAVDLVDPAGAFLDLYGIGAGGAVLVRPDGFVA
jgi:hypothetical protein